MDLGSVDKAWHLMCIGDEQTLPVQRSLENRATIEEMK